MTMILTYKKKHDDKNKLQNIKMHNNLVQSINLEGYNWFC